MRLLFTLILALTSASSAANLKPAFRISHWPTFHRLITEGIAMPAGWTTFHLVVRPALLNELNAELKQNENNLDFLQIYGKITHLIFRQIDNTLFLAELQTAEWSFLVSHTTVGDISQKILLAKPASHNRQSPYAPQFDAWEEADYLITSAPYRLSVGSRNRSCDKGNCYFFFFGKQLEILPDMIRSFYFRNPYLAHPKLGLCGRNLNIYFHSERDLHGSISTDRLCTVGVYTFENKVWSMHDIKLEFGDSWLGVTPLQSTAVILELETTERDSL